MDRRLTFMNDCNFAKIRKKLAWKKDTIEVLWRFLLPLMAQFPDTKDDSFW